MDRQWAQAEESSITEQVYDALKSRILTCELAPGAPLREQKLGKEHGVSGLPIRMALTRLAADGLAEQVYNRGYFVSRITITDLRESFELRKVLEPAVARLAAERATPDDRRSLEAFRDAHFQPGSERQHDRAREISEDYTFHRMLGEIARNRQLAHAVDRFWQQYIRIGYLVGREWDLIVINYENSKAGHTGIADAVINGQPDEAFRLMLEHCSSAERNLVMIADAIQRPG